MGKLFFYLLCIIDFISEEANQVICLLDYFSFLFHFISNCKSQLTKSKALSIHCSKPLTYFSLFDCIEFKIFQLIITSQSSVSKAHMQIARLQSPCIIDHIASYVYHMICLLCQTINRILGYRWLIYHIFPLYHSWQ